MWIWIEQERGNEKHLRIEFSTADKLKTRNPLKNSQTTRTHLLSSTRNKKCSPVICGQCINRLFMAFCSNRSIALRLRGMHRNVTAWIDRTNTCIWQRSQTISTSWTIISSCIIWFGNRSKCSFNIPYENLPTKACRGNDIALQCIIQKIIKWLWCLALSNMATLNTRIRGYC